jgi:hypothetical protein
MLIGLILAVAVVAAPEVRGKVASVTGEVSLYAAAFNKWKRGIRSGQPLYLGDRLQTGSGAKVQVTLFSKTGADTIDVGADTLFEIPDVVENAEEVSWVGMFSKAVGRIHCLITRKPPGKGEKNPFNVRTPTVVAGVRGTSFNVEYDHRSGTSFLHLNKGVINGLTYAGLALGALSTDEELAVTGLKVFRYASHLRNAQDFFGGNLDKVNKKYNRLFHIAEATEGGLTINDIPVIQGWWNIELPFQEPAANWNQPMVAKVTKGSATLHLRHTGWLKLEAGTELSCYRFGNAFVARLRKGTLHYQRSGPNQEPLKYGPALDFEVFMAEPGGGDLHVLDYTAKGGVTRATLKLIGGKPSVDVAEGQMKLQEVQ